DSFAGILRETLKDRAEVINAGVSGYGPLHELLYYHLEGRRYSPNAVALCFYAGDLMDGLYLPMEAFSGSGVDLAWVDRFVKGSGYSFATTAGGQGRAMGNLQALAGQALGLYHFRRYFSPSDILKGRSDLSVFLKSPDRRLLSRWKANLALIRQLAGLCRGDGVRFVIVAIPMWVQAHPDDWRPFARDAGLTPERTDLSQPQEIIAGLARELEVPLLDALPALRAKGASGRLYFRHDYHLNPAGHRALAEYLLAHAETLIGP
ncbi:MAG: hypothetical protein AB1921_02470, partial [Thermodesulfobacteriota bacterium]